MSKKRKGKYQQRLQRRKLKARELGLGSDGSYTVRSGTNKGVKYPIPMPAMQGEPRLIEVEDLTTEGQV